jgi:hypothetical protein
MREWLKATLLLRDFIMDIKDYKTKRPQDEYKTKKEKDHAKWLGCSEWEFFYKDEKIGVIFSAIWGEWIGCLDYNENKFKIGERTKKEVVYQLANEYNRREVAR